MSFDDLLKDLQGQNKVEEDENVIPLDRLFSDSFMAAHTRSENFGAFLEKGNFQAKTHDDIKNIEGELFDRHVARETDYADWQSMLDAANAEYAEKKNR